MYKGSKVLFAVCVISILGVMEAAAAKKTESVDWLIEAWADADENCAGGNYEDSATKKACDQRSKLSGQLGKQGMCLGKNGQSRSEYEWHKCTKNSVR